MKLLGAVIIDHAGNIVMHWIIRTQRAPA